MTRHHDETARLHRRLNREGSAAIPKHSSTHPGGTIIKREVRGFSGYSLLDVCPLWDASPLKVLSFRGSSPFGVTPGAPHPKVLAPIGSQAA
nr:hypothetical protein [Candidatus Freyrarchaeum guaymaensis]